MNPKRFFVNEKNNRRSKSKVLKKDLFFKFDDTPGYYKDGYYFDIKSIFTGWSEDGELPQDEPVERNQKIKKIIKDKSLFGEEITLRNKFIKKISFVPNYRLEDSINYFKTIKKKGIAEDDKIIIDKESNNNNNNNKDIIIEDNMNDDISYNNNDSIINDDTSMQVGRIYEGIKVGEEQLKEYKLKISNARKAKKNIFQIIKDIKKNNPNSNNDKDLEEDEKYNIQNISTNKLKDIENNEIKLLTPNDQNELLMFFIPDQVNATKRTICESCKGRGHSKEQCLEFPDPNYDKSLKFCMNCGSYGHLYCRNGIKDEDNIDDESDEDDENYIYNHGRKYNFDFDLNEGKKKRGFNKRI